MSFWFKTYREHSDDPQNTMLAEIYRLILQTRSEVTSTDTGSGDLEKQRVEVIPTESYIIIITGSCFVKGEGRPVNQNYIMYSGREPDADICRCKLDFNYRQNFINDRSCIGNNADLIGLPKIVAYQPEYPASSALLNGIDSHVDMGTTSNLKLAEGDETSGNSLLFDGIDDNVTCGNHTDLWSKPLTRFAFSFWFNPTAGWDGINRLMVRHGNTAHGFECDMDSSVAGQVFFILRDSVNTSFEANTSTQNLASLNRWNHVICSYDQSLGSANGRIYINGVLGNTTFNLTETINSSNTMELGGPSTDLQGRMKDFRWWSNQSFNILQASNFFNYGTMPSQPDYWLPMDEGTGTPIDVILGKTTTMDSTWTTGSPHIFHPTGVTVAAWVYFPSNPSSDAIIVARGNNRAYSIFVDSTGLLKAQFFYSDTTNAILNSTVVGTGAWHRVVASHSDATATSKLWIDGVLKASNVKNDYLRNSGTTGRFMLGTKPSTSILFDGSNDYIDCTNDATLWSQGLTKFSFSYWIYPTLQDGLDRTCVRHGEAGHRFRSEVDDLAGNQIFHIQNAANSADHLARGSGLVLNQWNFICCTYDNSLGSANVKIYVNGILGGTTANLTETINTSAILSVGGSPTQIDFKGNMKDFRWWTTIALNSTQITDVMNNSSSAPTPNYWLPMDEGTGNPVDSISGTKVGTLTNGPQWDYAQEGFIQGNIDDVKIWNRQLTDAEALADYNGDYVSPVGLVSEWDFDEDEHLNKGFDSQSYNTGNMVNCYYDKNQLPMQLTGNYPYKDGVINELIGYRLTGDEYMIIPELSDDFRIEGSVADGTTYAWLVKFSTFDLSNGRYMRLLEKADDFLGDYIQTVYIRDDGKLYVELRKESSFVQKVRTVYPLKLNKLYLIGVGFNRQELMDSDATGDEHEIIRIYLNGFLAPMEVTTATSDRPNDPDITNFHTYLCTESTDPGAGTLVGQIYQFWYWSELPDDANMLGLMCNKFTTRQIDRGHVLRMNLSKLHQSIASMESTLAGPATTEITDLFEYFISEVNPTRTFSTDTVEIDDEFRFTLTTPIHYYSLSLNGTTAYVEIPTIDPVRKHFSISVWVKYQSNTGGWAGIISRIDGMPNGNRLMMKSTSIRWHAKYGDASDPFVNYQVDGLSSMTGAWHHIAMTYDGEDDERLKLFLDGHKILDKHQEDQIKGGDDGDNGKTYIGKGADSNYYFGGNMDRLVIYDKTLEDEEVRKLARKERVRTGVMAEYNFEQTFTDESDDTKFHGKARGGATFSGDVP